MTADPSADRASIEAIRAAVLGALPEQHARAELSAFYQAMRSYPERSGKTLRGLLTLLSTEAHGAERMRGLRCAAAIELFQNWVLVHDDIEDDSEERRGLPALHRELGVPVALNVGDAMHVYMWQLLLEHPHDFVQRRAILDEFLTTIHRTAEGQHLDLAWVRDRRFDLSEEDYLEMVRLKTAHYTVLAPLRLGALSADLDAGDVPVEPALELGTAFQIRDDVLNLDRGVRYGKEFAGDLFEGKRTLILAHLFAHATTAERDEAIALLDAPRPQRTVRDVTRLLELIERRGSLAYAQQVARQRADHGLEALESWAQGLLDRGAALHLLDRLRTVAERTT